MFGFYPQAGVRFNPPFTDIQYAGFARDVEDHAVQLYDMAFAAFARAADNSRGAILPRLNFECLEQLTHNLLTLYRIACEDPRINPRKVGERVNLLFWVIIGAAEHLLHFAEDGDGWDKDWRSALDRGGRLARVAADLALAGAASGIELDQMMACLSRLAASTARARAYHLDLVREVPEAVDEVMGIVGDAGRLSAMLEEAAARLRARSEVEEAAV